MTLAKKRIVVLGGSSGIGLGVARASAREGAAIVIASSSQTRLDRALATLPSGTEAHAVDFADEAAIKTLFEQLGAFDHLVYTAGDRLQRGGLAATTMATARAYFGVRYFGAYMAAKFAHQNIRAGGSIVFTSGTAGHRPRAGWALGASVCAAMEGLTRALAVELAPIRVNIVAPGLVKTPLWDDMNAADREAIYRQSAERLPVGHAGEVDEVAETYLYLMRQTYGTGQVVIVDGGGLLV